MPVKADAERQSGHGRALMCAVVALGVLKSMAAVTTESFGSNPFARGWELHGETNLFAWESQNGVLNVTWDSSKTNSYCVVPLGTVCTDQDDFSVSFDLRLSDFQAGVNPQKPNTFQLALGFINIEAAKESGFIRGSGANSPDLVEFAFFPDPFGMFDSVTGSMCDSTGTNWAFGYTGTALTVQDLYRVTLSYTAADRTLRTTVSRNGGQFGPISDAVAGSSFQGFRVDRIGVCSYNDAGQDPMWSGSILAHGTVDNVVLTAPDVVKDFVGHFEARKWIAQCRSRLDYRYALERTRDLVEWIEVAPAIEGNGGLLTLEDSTPLEKAFYRIRAERRP